MKAPGAPRRRGHFLWGVGFDRPAPGRAIRSIWSVIATRARPSHSCRI